MVESERHINGEMSREQRYYLLSIESDVERFANAVVRPSTKRRK
jgi:hypothetical protein